MDSVFREMFEGLKQTADGLILANHGIKRAVDAALQTKDEQEDLRESVHRLESLVMDVAREVRDLTHGRNGDA